MTEPIRVFDDVLPEPHAYRAMALAQPFQTITTEGEVWKGIALQDGNYTLPTLQKLDPSWGTTRLTFFRQSPAGQQEPNFIHSDEGMGELTAILYLNPEPPSGDGTVFWRHKPTGDIAGSARTLSKDPDLWEPWRLVEAKFNRLLIFESMHFHSRAIKENYGEADNARLVQVAFGTKVAVTRARSIREARPEDLPAIVAMGQRFARESEYRDTFVASPEKIRETTEQLMAHHASTVLVAERNGRLIGMVAMVIFAHLWSGESVAQELVWWVEPEHRGDGLRLLKVAERWAADHGAQVMHMIAPNDRIGGLYSRLGYQPLETVWQRRI